MDVSHVIAILEKTISPDQNELQAAQRFLEQAAQQNLPLLLKLLSDVLRNVNCSNVARMQAGLQLKNFLYAKEESIRQDFQRRWLQLPEDVRVYVKRNCLETLGTEATRPSQAAQCIGYCACAELPSGLWPDLIVTLCHNVLNEASTETQREATLEAIGYICQDLEPELLVAQHNEIITAIVRGMNKDERSEHVRLAATQALLNSLEFLRANFEKENERHVIMQVVCEATQSTNLQVRVAALQNLVKIMSLYYQFMEQYMAQALFPITLEAMKSNDDTVALQGVEFWSNVCDEEMDLAIEMQDAMDQARTPRSFSKFYARGALQYLVPVLLQRLTQQDENDDEDEWNPCKASGVCLMLLSNCCENTIVQHVMPFISEHIGSVDWRFRDAAVMAFGAIVEGPDPEALKQVAAQAMPLLISLLNDSSVVVRDTTAWAISRVCEHLSDAIIGQQWMQQLLEALLASLDAEPRVATNICWALGSLSDAAYDAAQTEYDEEPPTYCLSPFFPQLVGKLLATTNRSDGSVNNLRSAAYEALMGLIKNSGKDCYPVVRQTTVEVLHRLHRTFALEGALQSANDKMMFHDLQSLLCATLQSVLRKVTPEDVPMIADQSMEVLLQMLGGSSRSVQEDALMAISSLTEVMQDQFAKYMDALRPFLYQALENHAEYQVCTAAVGLVGDLARSLGPKLGTSCDDIMIRLGQILGDESVNKEVKPQVLSVFGDIALGIGPSFTKYLEPVLQTLKQASEAQVDKSDLDLVDYLNELWSSCLEAYTGLIQGLKGDATSTVELQMLRPHLEAMLALVCTVANDPDHSESAVSAAAGLVGDLVTTFGSLLLPLVDNKPVNDLLTEAKKSKHSKTKAVAQWAHKEIKKLKSGSS